jgi:ProP effector
LSTNGADDKRAAQIAAARAVIALLAERWPRCFFVYEKRRKPLKIGVHLDVMAALGDTVSRTQLGIGLRYYVGNHCYLKACREGADRIGLDGQPSGKVSADEAKNSAASLAGRLAKKQTKKNAPASPAIAATPKRITLDDLRAAAARRQQDKAPADGARAL